MEKCQVAIVEEEFISFACKKVYSITLQTHPITHIHSKSYLSNSTELLWAKYINSLKSKSTCAPENAHSDWYIINDIIRFLLLMHPCILVAFYCCNGGEGSFMYFVYIQKVNLMVHVLEKKKNKKSLLHKIILICRTSLFSQIMDNLPCYQLVNWKPSDVQRGNNS